MDHRHLAEFEAEQYYADNGMPFAIINNPLSNHVMVSLAVRAGHFYDPEETPGLSHLLEHMIFMGSRQMPEPNGLIKSVVERGGSVNAWTSDEYANFHFTCAQEDTLLILPAFIETIVHPLMSEHYIEKEINSIEAEFRLKYKDELRRLYQVHKETSNPNHPFSRFSVGNHESFALHSIKDLKSHLMDYHRQRYVAKNMALTIAVPKPIKQLKDDLNQSLRMVTPGACQDPTWPPIYLPAHLKQLIQVKPLNASCNLIVSFAIQTLLSPIQSGLHLMAHLLGYEGKGGILSNLKDLGWATHLSAGSGIHGDYFKDFNISIQLTTLGEKNQQQIVGIILAYIRLIQQDNLHWRVEEMELLDEITHKYHQVNASLDEICQHAEDMLKTCPSMPFGRLKATEKILRYFTVNNMRIKLISPNAATNQRTMYYDTQYSHQDIPEGWLKFWRQAKTHPALFLPKPNRYLQQQPIKFEDQPEYQTPCVIINNPSQKIWLQQDTSLGKLEGDFYCTFDSHNFTNNPLYNASKKVWLYAVNDSLNEKLYQAKLAGLNYRIYGHQCGFTLHCNGFSQSIETLSQHLVKQVFDLKVGEKQFYESVIGVKQSLRNKLLNKPTNRLFARLTAIIQRHTLAPIQTLKYLDELRLTTFNEACEKGLQNLYCESLMYGNWSSEHAHRWNQCLSQFSSKFTHNSMRRDVCQIPLSETFVHMVPCEHDDSAVVYYLQAPSSNSLDTATCMILEQLFSGPFFNALRTEQQVGYMVGSGYSPVNQHPGIIFYVQSPSHSAKRVYELITAFLDEQLENISFYAHYWSSIRDSLIRQLCQTPHTMSMQAQALWLRLGNDDALDKRKEQLIDTIRNMPFEQIVTTSAEIRQSKFGKLLLFSPGNKGSSAFDLGESIDDIEEFKSQPRAC